MMSLERIAMEKGRPCYVSFKTALSYHGVIEECPYNLMCATLRDDFVLRCSLGLIEFIRVDEDCFFGYTEWTDPLGNPFLIAEPEKALLDWIMLCEERGYMIQLDEINWGALSRAVVDEYAGRMGIDYKAYLPDPAELRALSHPKYRMAADELERWLGGSYPEEQGG